MTTPDEHIVQIRGWLTGRLPADWFTAAPEITIDREEITVIGRIKAPAGADASAPQPTDADSASTATASTATASDTAGESASEPSVDNAERAATEAGRIAAFREDTRDARIRIARELEHRTGRKVAWGAECGSTRQLFTTMSVPVMTRLRQPERRVLDTLVEAGVARSRSDALAWSVKLVGQHSDEWLSDLRDALRSVEEVRGRGPA